MALRDEIDTETIEMVDMESFRKLEQENAILKEAVERLKISPTFNPNVPPRQISMVDAEGLEKLYAVLDSLNLNPKKVVKCGQ
jgi:hypothetical protein